MNANIYSWCSVIAAGQEYDLSSELAKTRLNQTSIFVASKLQSSPWIVRFGIAALYMSIGLFVLVTKGRTVSQLTDDEKRAFYYGFKSSRIAIKRDFLKFFESFVTLYWFHNS